MNLPFGFGTPDPNDPDRQDPNGPSGQDPFGFSAMGEALQQLGRMMQQAGQAPDSGEGIDWARVREVARKGSMSLGESTVSESDRDAVESAGRLASLWLDSVCSFPATESTAAAWSRAEWIEATSPAWERIITPVAESMVRTMTSMQPNLGDETDLSALSLPGMGDLPPEAAEQIRAMLGPLQHMAKRMVTTMFADQSGQAISALAGEVHGAADIGVPLLAQPRSALVPTNLRAFSEGLELTTTDVFLFAALREEAHQRLFTAVPWLRPRLEGAIHDYAAGITIDTSRIEEAMREIDPMRPESIQETLSSGVFEPQQTPAQRASLARLETMLALIEGWVDDVVMAATAERMPAAVPLAEAMRRRRAAGGPAERTFATLVGLELRPRRLREAARLWAALSAQGEREALWGHPDLLPSAEDLDDPEAFLTHRRDDPEGFAPSGD
jgi:putative hydrolase